MLLCLALGRDGFHALFVGRRFESNSSGQWPARFRLAGLPNGCSPRVVRLIQLAGNLVAGRVARARNGTLALREPRPLGTRRSGRGSGSDSDRPVARTRREFLALAVAPASFRSFRSQNSQSRSRHPPSPDVTSWSRRPVRTHLGSVALRGADAHERTALLQVAEAVEREDARSGDKPVALSPRLGLYG
jgi:hypothetical protein